MVWNLDKISVKTVTHVRRWLSLTIKQHIEVITCPPDKFPLNATVQNDCWWFLPLFSHEFTQFQTKILPCGIILDVTATASVNAILRCEANPKCNFAVFFPHRKYRNSNRNRKIPTLPPRYYASHTSSNLFRSHCTSRVGLQKLSSLLNCATYPL